MFIDIKNTNRTIIAKEALSLNARSALSDHIKIWTGSAVAGEVIVSGTSTINATIPIMRSGAVSPNAWAIPIIVPVKIPGAARGKIWSVAVCILDAPRPRAASLIEVGTALIDALVAIIIVGKVIKANTIPPTKGTDLGIPKKPRNTASPRSPKTIEGTAAKLLILTSMKSVILPGLAKYSKYIADITARGKASINVINKAKADPTAAPRIPALSGSLESALVKKVELKNKSKARLIRDGKVVYDGEISSIFREKNQVKEVKNGLECGISLKDFMDFKEKDIIEAYLSEKIDRQI